MTDAARGLAETRANVARAAADAGREAGAVTIVAVSKTIAADAIVPALAAGHRTFGENRVQEARAKWPALKARFPGVELHLVGGLQTNKAREAVGFFDVIHSLDRPALAEALAKEIARARAAGLPVPRLLVEVNTGEEAQKAGVHPEDADRFIADCRAAGLAIEGLMAIPPADDPPSPHFALLAVIARRNGLPLLSMGMSADFAQAIALGATHVRIGTAIFGPRT